MSYAKDPRRVQLVNLRQWKAAQEVKAAQERKAAQWPAFIPRSLRGLGLLCVRRAARPNPIFGMLSASYSCVMLILTKLSI
ncbi:hypothetical protein BQ8794_110156 [Mesorhizobium prunaredense]|uniref:Uncharacterized protein n=1 Tax=Mesorhizobium prunaredense TaxID=1631249 RepID=A0A1R3V0E0_9HYPH|nr:hypothetical protein [Mesorhizobium prunaredense]SIT53350.1 hypothetical protein BQ8794_110156 [Mesorhizobium prunaredense]